MSMRDQSDHLHDMNPERSVSPTAPPEPSKWSCPTSPFVGRPIRVLLVDDDPVVLVVLNFKLGDWPHLKVVGQVLDGEGALRKTKEFSPDIALMDINMSPVEGVTASAALRRAYPAVKVLFLTRYSHPECSPGALRAGCRGYVLKDAPAEDLVRAIETIHRGETIFGGERKRRALNQAVRKPVKGPRPSPPRAFCHDTDHSCAQAR